MAIESTLDINTRPFVLETLPVSLRDENAVIIQNAGRTTVLASKTLMGKEAVVAAVVVAADGGNTGDGTVTVASVVGLDNLGNKIIPKIGAYVFELTAALIGKITDPDGVDIVTGIAITDGGAAIIQFAGLIFTVTDGAIAFVSGDKFTITVATSNKWTPFSGANILGADKPKGVYDPEGSLGDILASTIVAGDVENMPIIKFGFMFDEDMLVMENSGSLEDLVGNTGLSVRDYLVHLSIIAKETQSGSRPENS
jgi:hypothetical protein